MARSVTEGQNRQSLERLGENRKFRLFVWGVVAMQVAILAALTVLSVMTAPYENGPPVTSVLPTLFGSAALLVFAAVGVLIFSRRPNHPIGWMFCLSQAGWTLNNFASGFGMYALRARPDLLPAARWVAWLYPWPGKLSTGIFLILILLFPDGHLPSRRWKPVAWLIIAWTVVSILTSAFAPGPVDTSRVLPLDNPLGAGGSLGSLLVFLYNSLISVAILPLVILVALSAILRFRSARGQTRLQLKWLAVAIAVIALLWVQTMALMTVYPIAAATPVWALALEQLTIFSLTLIPISAGIAILRYRLYEIDRIINQALVYFSLTAALALVYFGCVLILQALFSAITGKGQSSLVTVLSTLAIAALFTPLRQRFQQAIDRRFYRQKFNSQLILDRFGSVLRSEVDLQVLSDQMLAVIEETFQPNQTALWLNKKEK